MKHLLFWFFLILCGGIALGRAEFWAGIGPAGVVGPGGMGEPGQVAAFVIVLLVVAWFAAARSWRICLAAIVAAALGIGLFLSLASPNRIMQAAWVGAIGRAEGSVVVMEGVMTEGRRAWRDGYGRDRYSFTIQTPEGGARVFGTFAEQKSHSRNESRRGDRRGPEAGGRQRDSKHSLLPAYGERVRVIGKIAVPGGRTNPAGFDWRTFLRTRGSYAVLRAEKFEVTGPPRGWAGAIFSLREKLVRRMDAALGDEAADISKAIFLGERSELEPDFRRALVNTGTLHLFAISGFNVGFVALVLFGALTLIRVPDPMRSFIVLGLLAGYAILVGDNSPVVRAVIMSFFLIGAELLRTRVSALQGLGAAGVLMLVMNPEEVFDPAFQLSFAAVMGLALIVPVWGALEDVRRARSDRWQVRLWAAFTITVLTSLAAWVTTAPILIHHFHRFSVVAPVINILLVPIAFLLNLLLMIFAFLACVFPAAAGWTAPLIEGHVIALTSLVDWFDRVPGASWNLAAWHWPAWAAFAAWWAWLAYHRKRVRRSVRVTLSILAVLGLIGADAARAHASVPALRVTHFDVGQASAALVELGTARILIDAGRGGDADAAGRVILPYLASIGASRIDAVIITHPQFDHMGGLRGLMNGARIGEIWINGDRNEAAFFRDILNEAERLGVPVRTVRRGDRVRGLPGGARLSFLHPGGHVIGRPDLNERSTAGLLEAEGHKYLWTGDLGEQGIGELLASAKISRVDLLQVPHHGARTGPNAAELLGRARPVQAVISSGAGNRYGHPHPTTLEALTALPTRVHRTDQEGAHQLTVAQN